MTFQINREEGLFQRQTLFDQARRVVVKVGSAVLTGENGLDPEVIGNLARQLSFLCKSGREVILVSSGAVSAGRRKLGLRDGGNGDLKVKQALAAVGQGLLMQAYEQRFQEYGQGVAQILLTHDDLSRRHRYLNIRNTILTLFQFGVLPIVNENDTVSVEELRLGDNDTLAAMITNMIEADMLILLSDVEGLYARDPAAGPENGGGDLVYTVAEITEEIREMAGYSKSAMGTGGMRSKIEAARMVAACGGSSFIGSGRTPDILKRLFSGEMTGTFFLPRPDRMKTRKHWIAHVLRPEGYLVLDAGACTALRERGKSLLPSGIREVRGDFDVGAPVHCLDESGTAVAAGLCNYAARDIDRIKGVKSSEIKTILGYKDSDVVIHRDNLMTLENDNRGSARR